MSWAKNNESVRSMLFSVAVLSLAALGLWFGASFNNTSASTTDNAVPAATFNGTGVGPIPDLASGCQPTQGTPLNVTFNVTGQTGSPTNVALSTTFGGPNHSWAGDVTATLISPSGQSHSVFGRVLATTATAAGDSSDLGGTYTFADSNTTPPSGGFWQAATAEATGAAPIAPGAYRTTGSGGAGATNPMPATNMNAAFASATANGTWTLRLTDGCAADTGAISAAVLTIDTAPVMVNNQHVVDFDGNGRSDFAVVRNTGGGAGGQVTWFVNLAGVGTTFAHEWGIATDEFVPEDYDGDNKTDIAIWRPISTGQPSGNGFFYIFQSSNFTVRIDDFGQVGDDPSVVGDYDGDGKADPAVYRGGATAGAPSNWWYKGSLTPGTLSSIQWGQNGDFPAPGDYDGDGKNDFVIQRNNGGGTAAFWMKQTTAGNAVRVFGTPTDVIVPGDYDGDGKTDIAVVRGNAGAINWFVMRSSDGGTNFYTWGASATDFPTQGDYDGDGKTDPAIWRASATPGASAFWVLGSTSGPGANPFGANGDYPVANYNSH